MSGLESVVRKWSGWLGCGLLVLLASPPSGFSQASSCVTAPPSLIAWWKGDDANDVVGGNHTIFNGGVSIVPGMVGQAFGFDGVNDYVQTPLSSNFLPLTMEFWFRTGSSVSGELSVVDSDYGGRWGHSVIIGYASGDRTIDIQYHNGQADTGVLVTPNTWYHVGVTFSSRLQAYVDGVLRVDQPYSPPGLDGDTFRLGRHNPGDPQWFNGLVDEISIYNRALTQAEIQAVYTAGSSGKCAETACDGADDNANGVVDEGCYQASTCDTVVPVSWKANAPANDCVGPVDVMGRSWYEVAFDDSSWTPVILKNSWSGSDRYYRGRFTAEAAGQPLTLTYSSDDKIKVFLNSSQIALHGSCHQVGCVNAPPSWGCSANEPASAIDLSPWVVPGLNVLAVWVTNGMSGAQFDARTTDFGPGAPEVCDGVDNQCPGGSGYSIVDEGCDQDGDDYCNSVPVGGSSPACPNGGGDCDDQDPVVHPGAPERCNQIDDNCNALVDMNDNPVDSDFDNDGLLDCWELYGINENGDTFIELPLHQSPFNANRLRPDVFVEVDYMTGHKPRPGVIESIESSFAAAPIVACVGCEPGVALHASAFLSDEIPEAAWTGFGEFFTLKTGDPLYSFGDPIQDSVCSPGTAYFGNRSDRDDEAHCGVIIAAKARIFRYAMFVNQYYQTGAPKPDTGATVPPSEYGAAGATFGPACATGSSTDFLIADQSLLREYYSFVEQFWTLQTTTFEREWATFQAHAFMHELGHSLGLRHGGDVDTNCKPNYLSVMNYGRQFNPAGGASWLPGHVDGALVRLEGGLGFSDGTRSVLNESALDEAAGVGGVQGQMTTYGYDPGVLQPTRRLVGPTGMPVNWNDSGEMPPTPESGVSSDVNDIPDRCSSGATQTLVDFNDWNRIRECAQPPAFASLAGPGLLDFSSITIDELDAEDYFNGTLGSDDVDEDGVPNPSDSCPLNADLLQENEDGDARGDVCDCAPADALSWTKPSEVMEASFRNDQTLAWEEPAFLGSTIVAYDVLRSMTPFDFGSAVCVETSDGDDTEAVDPMTPGAGGVFYYLVRAGNTCPNSEGPLGSASDGTPRVGVSCL